MAPTVYVQAAYGSPTLGSFLTAFEANLDPDEVQVRRGEAAVKAFIPLDLVITVGTVYALERLILAPLIDPIAERFNWVSAVTKYLEPNWPFRLSVEITEDRLTLEADLDTAHDITRRVWLILRDVIAILREENRLCEVTQVRLIPDNARLPLVLCYDGNRPKYKVDLVKRKTLLIAEGE